MDGLVSNTDRRWFDFLQKRAQDHGGILDEVNFWRPRSQRQLRSVGSGAPFFLRLKAPARAIAGFGFFAHWQLVPIREAWALFADKNGAADFPSLRRRIAWFRGCDPAATDATPLGCIILRDVVFLHQDEWLPWSAEQAWSDRVVADRRYDLTASPGNALLGLMQARSAAPLDLALNFELLHDDTRVRQETTAIAREGQGTFRLRLLNAYGSRCALTGERVVPVLEAAHIQRYLGPASNHVQNGLLLRSDLHHLYDVGYVTVSSDYRFRVSERIRDEYENGRDYYALAGRPLRLPADRRQHPSREALAWHEECCFS